ncbi:hypothetical protein [Streptomyces paromomycinus]|uniref:hypothetical protein n=1 Tax=Streptomyces paromomycinus TaxID=92743 RepID=UPI001478FE03|nr:hypothetical protein [Streptomyces paromomycinus]
MQVGGEGGQIDFRPAGCVAAHQLREAGEQGVCFGGEMMRGELLQVSDRRRSVGPVDALQAQFDQSLLSRRQVSVEGAGRG